MRRQCSDIKGYVCVCERWPGGVVVKISDFQPDGWEFYITRGRKKIWRKRGKCGKEMWDFPPSLQFTQL